LFPGAVIRASALTAVSAAMLAAPLLACTTALPPRPVADYQAAPIVVVGILEEAGPNLVVRVETRYRGPDTARIALRPPDLNTWCPFPLGVPAVGERVLLAVADRVDWQWPNSAAWAIDSHGRIRDTMAPWSGAPAPATLGEALETMGIPPDTATDGESDAALPLVVLLAVVAAVLAVLATYMGMNPRGRR
jgi:hypothetical protein